MVSSSPSFFFFCCLIAGNGAGSESAGASCPLKISPAHVVVRYAAPLTATCNATTTQAEGLGWESAYGGTGLMMGVASLALNVSSVSSWEVAPTCFINLLGGDQCVETLPVTVYKTPDNVSLSGAALARPLLAGQTVRLHCEVANVAPARSLQLVWRRTGGILGSQTFEDRAGAAPVNLTSDLELRPDGELDGSQVWCEAKLSFGTAGPELPSMSSEPRDVQVLYPPVFTSPANETLTVGESERIRLDCSAKGNPAPLYHWHLPHTVKQEVEGQREGGAILEPPVTTAGTYRCSASNAQGSSSKSFTVSHAPRGRTTLAAMMATFMLVGVLIAAVGLKLLKPDGMFSCSKDAYQPAAAPI